MGCSAPKKMFYLLRWVWWKKTYSITVLVQRVYLFIFISIEMFFIFLKMSDYNLIILPLRSHKNEGICSQRVKICEHLAAKLVFSGSIWHLVEKTIFTVPSWLRILLYYIGIVSIIRQYISHMHFSHTFSTKWQLQTNNDHLMFCSQSLYPN